MNTATDLVIRSFGRWKRTGDQVFGGAGYDEIDFNEAVFEEGGVVRTHTETTTRYSLPRRGFYLVTLSIALSVNAADDTIDIQLVRESTPIRYWRNVAVVGGGTSPTILSLSTVVAADDAMELAVRFQTSGASSVLGEGTLEADGTWIEITRLGDGPIPAIAAPPPIG